MGGKLPLHHSSSAFRDQYACHRAHLSRCHHYLHQNDKVTAFLYEDKKAYTKDCRWVVAATKEGKMHVRIVEWYWKDLQGKKHTTTHPEIDRAIRSLSVFVEVLRARFETIENAIQEFGYSDKRYAHLAAIWKRLDHLLTLAYDMQLYINQCLWHIIFIQTKQTFVSPFDHSKAPVFPLPKLTRGTKQRRLDDRFFRLVQHINKMFPMPDVKWRCGSKPYDIKNEKGGYYDVIASEMARMKYLPTEDGVDQLDGEIGPLPNFDSPESFTIRIHPDTNLPFVLTQDGAADIPIAPAGSIIAHMGTLSRSTTLIPIPDSPAPKPSIAALFDAIFAAPETAVITRQNTMSSLAANANSLERSATVGSAPSTPTSSTPALSPSTTISSFATFKSQWDLFAKDSMGSPKSSSYDLEDGDAWSVHGSVKIRREGKARIIVSARNALRKMKAAIARKH